MCKHLIYAAQELNFMASEIVEEPTEIMEGPSETFTEERPRIARPVINWV